MFALKTLLLIARTQFNVDPEDSILNNQKIFEFKLDRLFVKKFNIIEKFGLFWSSKLEA